MKTHRSLLFLTLFVLLKISSLQLQQACPQGGVAVSGIHSGVIKFPYDDLNEGAINKNYFQQIDEGALDKNKRTSVAFSIVSFEGSGRQGYYSLMIKQFVLQNQNTRLSIMMDFQYPNSNMLSIWTEISVSYLIVSQNLERNGFSYVWTYNKNIDLKGPLDGGIVDGDLFNHLNDKKLCGYDGKYWHTDGCKNLEAVSIYHCYISGWKFDPAGNSGNLQFAFSVQLLNKLGQVSSDQKQDSLDVKYNQGLLGGPRLKIQNFYGQLEKIKVTLVMSIIQVNYASYPVGNFEITYSGMYFFEKNFISGQKIIKREKQSNIYHFQLPGIKYFIYGLSRFIASKGLPRQSSIMMNLEVQSQNAVFLNQNFRLPKSDFIISGDFYYKRINRICQSQTESKELQKRQISQIKFQNVPSNESTYIIRTVEEGDIILSQQEVAIQYIYYPNSQIEQSSWVTYSFSQIKYGGSYIFQFSVNEIGIDGIAEFMGYPFAIYVNQKQLYRNTLVGTQKNDKIQGIQRGLNINNDTITVKIYLKIYRQQQKNIRLRISFLVKQLPKVFNPITQCCSSTCPSQSGLNITSSPVQYIVCQKQKGFRFNEKRGVCSCIKGLYFIQEAIFPKCLPCEAALCDMCEPLAPKKCIECVFGAQLDPYIRTCSCLPEFKQMDNKCLLNAKIQDVCIKYGYCDQTIFQGLVYVPAAVKCVEGQYDNGQGQCSLCNKVCLTCSNMTSCLSCDEKAGRVFQNGLCICRSGYFQLEYQNKTRVCLKCAPQCLTCSTNSESCTDCDKDKFMQKVVTPKGFFTCECLPGYHSDGKGNCIESNCNADKYCSSCQENKLCTSCLKAYKRVLQLPEHICVCMWGYFENQAGECQKCKDGCANCNSSNMCLSCVVSAEMSNEGSCQCQQGTFFKFNQETNVGYCKKCPATCETCIDEKNCITCAKTYALTIKQSCECPSSHFVNKQTRACTQCTQGCLQCNTLNNCTVCEQFYNLEEGKCVRNCRMAYYKTEKQCFKCGGGCARCDHSLSCDTCMQGYILYQSQCYKDCPQGTIKLPNKTQCIPCNSPCKTCMYHPSNCVSCQHGKGYLQQIGDQMKCLIECPLGTFPLNGVCQLCDLNCLSCLGGKSNCIECPVGHHLFKGQCHHQCPGVFYEGMCINFCPNGYFLFESSKCVPCSIGCLTCESSSQKCLTCRSGMVLKDHQCIDKCSSSEFQENGKCLECSTLCKTCSGNQFNCTSCSNESLLVGSMCQEKCSKQQYFSLSDLKCLNCLKGCLRCSDSNNCNECESLYTLNQDQCESLCDYPCLTCFEKSQCTQCLTGFYLMEKQMECVAFCPIGMKAQNGKCKCVYGFYYNASCHFTCPLSTYADFQQKTCKQCQVDKCLKCSNHNLCEKCEQNYVLSSNQDKCIPSTSNSHSSFQCPQGFTMQNNNCAKICNQKDFSFVQTSQNGTFCVYGKPQRKQIGCLQCKQKCSIGFYFDLKDQQCKRCESPCMLCKDLETCQTCQNGFELIKNECFSIKCPQRKVFFKGNCFNQCPKGTYVHRQICQQICPKDHFFYEGLCYMQCPDNSPLILDFTCVNTCPKGYNQKGRQCLL